MTELNTITPNTSEHKGNTGCLIAGCLGLAWLFLMVALGIAAAVIYFVYAEPKQTDSYYDDYNYNYNFNTNTDYYDDNNVNVNTNEDFTTSDSGELFDSDGNSYGFATDGISIKDDLRAYQVGAIADTVGSSTKWPALRATIDYPKEFEPLTNEDQSGSMWVGATLDNGYFVQIGMISSTTANTNGKMEWSYFWQMWDDQDHYLYGLEKPMSNYGWDKNESNEFSVTCQDPATGEWEFWVNGDVVGRTNTKSCELTLSNSFVYWELTTPETDKSKLPIFGPFEIDGFEYWDGLEWFPIDEAHLSYSYGLINEGTTIDQASVCPPFGGQSIINGTGLSAGTSVDCWDQGSVLWTPN